ncbi:hypothetical protein RMQ97_14515 [Maricaulis sp. D1M11]
MPIFSPPPVPAGYLHFRSDIVSFHDQRTGQLIEGWIYSIVHLQSGETLRSFGEDLLEIAHLIDTRIMLPVFGDAS